ncbi:MAG: hypothetical protein U0325_21270 [Polyangiales bacterium]
MRPSTRILLTGLCAAVTGCYVQLSAGLYAVQGGGARGAAQQPSGMAPSFGVTAGVVYDPMVVRAMAGAGTQSLTLPQREPTQVALTGPVHLQLDVALPVITDSQHYARRAAVFRVGVGGTTDAATVFVRNPSDGTLEGRSTKLFHLYLPLTLDLFVGNAPYSFMTAGLSVAPAMFVGTGNRGEDLLAFGGDLRLTFAIPITPHNGINFSNMFASRATPQQVEEMRQLAEQVRAREAARDGNRLWEMSQQSNRDLEGTQRRLDYLNCINRGGGTRCRP